MNSIRNVQRAIEHEIKRQVDLIEAGKIIDQDTRSFDASTATTFSLRSKEMANDYRYFPEPDLQPFLVRQNYIEKIKKEMPPLPDALFKKYVKDFGLSEYDAGVITENKQFALYFEELTRHTKNFKAAANWMMGSVKSYLNENALEITDFVLKPQQIAQVIALVDEGKVSSTVASQTVFPELVKNLGTSPLKIAEEKNLIQQSDENALMELAKQAVAKFPDKVKEYRSGKVGLIGLFMGELMKLSGGKADPKVANRLVKELLEKEHV